MSEAMTRPVDGAKLLELAGNVTTGELATRLGVTADNLRKWKRRGHLSKAPLGQHGQGRGNECLWSPEAQQEARWYRDNRTNDPFWKARALSPQPGVDHDR